MGDSPPKGGVIPHVIGVRNEGSLVFSLGTPERRPCVVGQPILDLAKSGTEQPEDRGEKSTLHARELSTP